MAWLNSEKADIEGHLWQAAVRNQVDPTTFPEGKKFSPLSNLTINNFTAKAEIQNLRISGHNYGCVFNAIMHEVSPTISKCLGNPCL